jgi:AraC-like DNA-binding protein
MRVINNPYSKTFYIWGSMSATFYYGGITPPHSHSTIQLLFDITDVFKYRIKDGPWETGRSIIIDKNTLHQLNPNNGIQLIIYLDSQSSVSKALVSRYLKSKLYHSFEFSILEYFQYHELERFLIKPDGAQLADLISTLLSKIFKSVNPLAVIDVRIQKVLDLILRQPVEEISIKSLAARVFLSPSRLRYLFKRDTGVSLHRFILGNRIKRAMVDLVNGATIQEASFDNGFTDSSHFHKLLVKMYGVTPSQFLRSSSNKSILRLAESPMKMHSVVLKGSERVSYII